MVNTVGEMEGAAKFRLYLMPISLLASWAGFGYAWYSDDAQTLFITIYAAAFFFWLWYD